MGLCKVADEPEAADDAQKDGPSVRVACWLHSLTCRWSSTFVRGG